MKKLKSISDFQKDQETKKVDLSTVYGGKQAAYSFTGCNDSFVYDPPRPDCSDLDGVLC